MSDKQQNKDGIKIWLKINDLNSARKAAELGSIVSGFGALAVVFNIVSIYFYGHTLSAEVTESIPVDKSFYYFQLITTFFIMIFFAFITFRIYKQKKFGFIPFLTLWMLLETGFKLYTYKSGGGIVISIIIAYLAITSFRGWLGLRKYQKT